MITDFSEAYEIIREKYIKMKKEITIPLLKFISESNPCDFCVLCDVELFSIKEKTGKSVETLLCDCCIVKLHSNPPRFVLKLDVPENMKGFQKFIEETRGIYSKWDTNCDEIATSEAISYEKLKLLLEHSLNVNSLNGNLTGFNSSGDNSTNSLNVNLTDGNPSDNLTNDDSSDNLTDKKDCSLDDIKNYVSLQHFIRNYKNKFKRDEIKSLIRCRIKSKIDLLEDQLINLEKTHSKALELGKFDDSEAIKEMYFTMYENKITLQEKLYKFT